MLIHDFMNHLDYAYTHEQFTDNLYLLNLSKHLYDYIHHCLQCKLIQTLQHCLYKSMQYIFMSS